MALLWTVLVLVLGSCSTAEVKNLSKPSTPDDVMIDLAQGAYTKAREGDVVQKRETYFAALSFASPETWNQIREIADGHPDLKIRQAAKVTLGNKMPDREKRR